MRANRVFGLVLAAALVASACGGSGAPSPNGSGASGAEQTPGTATTEPTEQPTVTIVPTTSQTPGVYGLPCGGGLWQGERAWTWCGPATAKVVYGSKTYELPSGLCEPNSPLGYLVHFGTVSSAGGRDTPGSPPWLNVLSGLNGNIVSGRFDGHPWAVKSGSAMVTVATNKQSGTFSGPTIEGIPVKGSWTC